MKSLLIVTFSILLNFGCDKVAFGQGQAPVITIADGQLRGTTSKTINSNVTYYSYRGIPYAKKPIGDLRFAAPVKNDPWTGILNATADRYSCVQLAEGVTLPGTTTATIMGSEDCLYINVYTTNVNGSLPVMVWIYGGGFYSGSSDYNTYAPDYLLEKDVVYVAFNYRLGIFGFLSTEDLESPGNWGLKDQILALKWVKNNIRQFGGDPSKVTIFGESAGSASISYLLQSPQTKGLYEGAIMESGNSLSLWALTLTPKIKAFKVGITLGIITFSTRTLVDQLRKIDYRTLKLAENNITSEQLLDNILVGLPFGVAKEPEHSGAVFSDRSWKLLQEGKFQRVPLIAGYNSLEGGSIGPYLQYMTPVINKYEVDKSLLTPYGMSQNIIKRYIAGVEISKYFFNRGSIESQPESLTRFLSVDIFNRPIREGVILASKYTQVYYYKFSYKGLLGDPSQISPGATHAEELRYLFVSPNRTVNEHDRTIIEKFVTLWTNFAKTGNPTPHSGTQNDTILGGLTWSPNGPNKNTSATIEYLNINNTLTMQTNPFQNDWIFYENLYSKYGDPPYTTY
ncbi:juvenile hormone esterase-like [Euwallacea similis]|uniref:juvenile hormone esterase-like n=1 Tax=Euwallacea similis TaxID=1736056 RepID=UPI003450E05C